MNEREILKLRERINLATKKRDKLLGASEQILQQLKQDFGVETIEEAKALLKAKMKKQRKKYQKLEKMKEQFEEEHTDGLRELEDEDS